MSLNINSGKSWSHAALNLVQRLNNFRSDPVKAQRCLPFLVDGVRVGTIPPFVLPHLCSHPDVFTVIKKQDGTHDHVTLATELNTFEERTESVDQLMKGFRKNDVFITLRGWRDEMYPVSSSFYSKPFFKMERSATCLLGIAQYGVHLNGYIKSETGISMWIGKRSMSKQTYPGKLDNVVAGGISFGAGIKETLIKECSEEASIPEDIAAQAVPCGTVSYLFEDERGLFPELQFVYDICLPQHFTPVPNDKEVSEFYCWPINKVKEMLVSDDFKPNCALIILDFLIRHGIIDPDTEPLYVDFIRGCHQLAGV